jgi:lipid II:glycine glycyltransferase (peptidoglycan interpeptide bridge formation enzyme)
MAEITVKVVEDKNEWEAFLYTHEEANFLQSWYWGEFYRNLGNVINRTGFYENKKLIGVMLSIVESAKRGKYLIVPGGPIIDWNNKSIVKYVFQEMKKISNQTGCTFVRVRPQLLQSETTLDLFKQQGARMSPMHLTADLTHQLDLTKSEEELLSAMRKATRYEIRKAEKLGVQVSASKDVKLISSFYKLQLSTARRQKFVPFSEKFFSEQFKVFFNADKAHIYTAIFQKKVLAQAFVIFYGSEAVYHYGVSTEEGRKYPGAYLIQWEAIKEAKKRGLKKYNFWGVAPVGDNSHRFAGVSLFKRGFGGEDVQYLPAHDIIINRQKYLVNFVIETVRRRIRGL